MKSKKPSDKEIVREAELQSDVATLAMFSARERLTEAEKELAEAKTGYQNALERWQGLKAAHLYAKLGGVTAEQLTALGYSFHLKPKQQFVESNCSKSE